MSLELLLRRSDLVEIVTMILEAMGPEAGMRLLSTEDADAFLS